jgi:ABC-2 type transport system ATP-binding protein
MTRTPATRRVEVSFVGIPPARQVERASGVSEVEVDGPVLRCLVCGSFQPFLEALRGHEVVDLSTTPVAAGASEANRGDAR